MGSIVRLLVMFVALACGAAAAVIALPVLAVLDPVTREAGFLVFFASIASSIALSPGPEEAAGTLMLLLRTVTLAICVAPLVVAALIGEAARLRSWLWYGCCSGAIAAAMPFILRIGAGMRGPGPQGDAASAENRFMLLFFFVGLTAGTIYWLIAGRNAGRAAAAIEGRPG